VSSHLPYRNCSQCGGRTASRSGLCRQCRQPDAKARFLRAYLKEGTVGEAARACKLDRATVYGWLDQDKAFQKSYQDLQHARRDKLVSILYHAAVGNFGSLTEVVVSRERSFSHKVPRQLSGMQLQAILNFLRATDHLSNPHDSIVFADKRREIPEEPPKQIQWIEIHDAQPRVD
jgi:hypothetical protein